MIAPIRDDVGKPAFFIGTQMEIQNHSSQGFGLKQSRRRVLALTSKQRLVLQAMSNGFGDQQIGDQLGIGTSAVKRLRGRLMEKLGVQTIADAIRIGIQAGMADPRADLSSKRLGDLRT